jgi:hypothetical protein
VVLKYAIVEAPSALGHVLEHLRAERARAGRRPRDLLGTMLALRWLGRYGLLYIDGDADYCRHAGHRP